MEEQKRNWTLWIILVLIVGLLLSCGVGAFAGGIAGYYAGQIAADGICSHQGPFGYRMEPRPRGPWRIEPEPRMPEMPVPEILPERLGGVEVIDVVQDGPADRAGLRVGSIIFEVNGEPLDDDDRLSEIISRYDPGDVVELLIAQGGRKRVIVVELGRHPDKGGETAWLGITYRPAPLPQFRFDFKDSPRFKFDFQAPRRGE